jgi:hypothetical protein
MGVDLIETIRLWQLRHIIAVKIMQFLIEGVEIGQCGC